MRVGSTARAIVLLLAALVSIYALALAFLPAFRPPFVEALFAEKPLRALGHLSLGGVALATGGLQFSARLRIERPGVHRNLGKVYIGAVVLSGASALLLAPRSAGGHAAHFGFGMLAVLWLVSTSVAWRMAANGRFASHREWMIRSYALCLAAVTLKIYLPLSAMAGVPFASAYPAISWLCWVPNLVLAEWLFVRGSFVPLADHS